MVRLYTTSPAFSGTTNWRTGALLAAPKEMPRTTPSHVSATTQPILQLSGWRSTLQQHVYSFKMKFNLISDVKLHRKLEVKLLVQVKLLEEQWWKNLILFLFQSFRENYDYPEALDYISILGLSISALGLVVTIVHHIRERSDCLSLKVKSQFIVFLLKDSAAVCHYSLFLKLLALHFCLLQQWRKGNKCLFKNGSLLSVLLRKKLYLQPSTISVEEK